MALARKNRLTSKKDFNLVLRRGSVLRGHFLLIRHTENSLPSSRFGFMIPLKVSRNTATRNRIKRILSKLVYDYLGTDKGGYDVLVVVNAKEKAETLAQDLAVLLEKFKKNETK